MLGRPQLHQQLVAHQALALQRLQALDIAAQPPVSHAALFVDAGVALRQHVHVLLGGQPLDLHAVAHLRPGLVQEVLLQLGQPSLGSAHEVARADAAHLGQAVLGGDAAVHHPDAIGAAVAMLDAVHEAAQGAGVGGASTHHFVAQRETLGRPPQQHASAPTLLPAWCRPIWYGCQRQRLECGWRLAARRRTRRICGRRPPECGQT